MHTHTGTARIIDVPPETDKLSVRQVSGCIAPGRGVGVTVIVLDLIYNLLRSVLVKYSIHGLDSFHRYTDIPLSL